MIELGMMLGILGLVLLIIATPIFLFSDKTFTFKMSIPIIGGLLFAISVFLVANPLHQMSVHSKVFPLQVFPIAKSSITINVETDNEIGPAQLEDLLSKQSAYATVTYSFNETPKTITESYESLQDLANNLKDNSSTAKLDKSTGLHVTFIGKNKQIYQADFETASEVPHKLTSRNLSKTEDEYSRKISWDKLIYTKEAPVHIITHWTTSHESLSFTDDDSTDDVKPTIVKESHTKDFNGTLVNGTVINIK